MYLNEKNCGKWLVLHERYCCCVSLTRVTWCWLCDRQGKVFWLFFTLLPVVVVLVMFFCGFVLCFFLTWRIRPLNFNILSISVFSCVSFLFGKLAKHYRFQFQSMHICIYVYALHSDWKNVSRQCKKHLCPHSFLFDPFLFSLLKRFHVTDYRVFLQTLRGWK